MASKKVEVPFQFGETAYIKHDIEQLPRMVTGLSLRSNGWVIELSQGLDVSSHWEFEVSRDENQSVKLGIEISAN